ncbi:serine O-acetyltransferase EpsC [Ignavigranum ruoffiae]
MKANKQKWKELAHYIMANDPANPSYREVVQLYPGFKAIKNHEPAHRAYLKGRHFLARKLSERNRHQTGIEIHPGAELGDNIFIDHGMGVVIGETAIVGDRVKMYHGVTLGGLHGHAGEKRHPTIEHDVEIGAHAILLGDITIGHHSKIGAGAVVLEEVPPYSTVVGVPGRVIHRHK